MAFYHRKFLLNKPDKKYASSCYICYVCPQECYLKSPPPPPPPLSQISQSKNHQTSLILILLLFVLGTVFLFLSYLTIAKYRSRRRNSEPFENNNYADQNHHVSVLDHPIWYIRTVGLPQSSIDSISIFKYKKGKRSIESTNCSVCLSEFHENESLKLLPKCSHAFHVPCIDPWLRSHKNCPVCRAPVLIQGPNNSEENQSENEMGTRPEVQTGEDSSENQLAHDINLSISELNLDQKNNKFRVFSDLADRRLKLDQELEKPVRRSVSMDFSSRIFCTKKDEGCSDQNSDVIAKRGRKNSTVYTMLKSSSLGPSLGKKACFHERPLRKNSRSLEAISIPEPGIFKIEADN